MAMSAEHRSKFSALRRQFSFDMSIIQKFLTNQIASYEIIIVMTPYCPTPQHVLHMQEGFHLLRLMTFSESKCPGYLHFPFKFLSDALQGC